MYTFRENASFFWERYFKPNLSTIKKFLFSILIFLIASILVECFVFNFNFFATVNNRPVDLREKITAVSGDVLKRDAFKITDDNKTLEFNDLNIPINSIYIKLPNYQTAQVVKAKIQFTDDAHAAYFDTTEYTTGIPDLTLITNNVNSQYKRMNSTGNVRSLKVEFSGDGKHDVQYPILLDSMYLNANIPFQFVAWRMWLVFGICVIVYIFRPKSAIYHIRIREHEFVSKAGIIGIVAVELAILSAFTFYGSNLVGVATSEYNFGDWDKSSLINTYDVGGKSAQQYSELAKALSKGQVYLDEEPPNWLKEFSNPYDKSLRDEAEKRTGEPALFDVAYFQGHYYVYFGVVPALIFHLPFYLITGGNFPTAIGVLICVAFFILGITALLHRFAKYHFEKVNIGIFIILQAACVFCCGVMYLLKFPNFYSLPIACSLALSVWGLYFWMRGRSREKKRLNYFVGSACMALVLGARPTLVILSLVAIPLFWRTYITKKRITTCVGVQEFICLIAPYIIVAMFLFVYNYLRFGSFFDFGANYNLTVHDMTRRGLSFGRILPALFAFFIQPPNVNGVFPFVQECVFSTTYVGQTVREATFGGIFATLPILWFLLCSTSVIRLRNSQRNTRTVSGVIFALIFGGTLLAIMDAEVAGILQRYFADFTFLFIAAAVLIIFILNENVLHEHNLDKGETNYQANDRKKSIVLSSSLLKRAIILSVSISIIYSFLLCFVPETGWYSDIYPWAYETLIDNVLFWM